MERGKFWGLLKGDFVIWMVIIILCVYSLLVVYSSTTFLASKDYNGNTEYLLIKQFIIIFIGFFIMWFIHRIRWSNAAKKSALILLIVAWGLLILTMFFGIKINGAVRWIKIPFINLTFQTSDLVKVLFIIYLASIMGNIKKYESNLKTMTLKLYAPILITCGLMFKQGFSSTFILFTTALVMMFFARASFKSFGILISGSIIGVLLIFSLSTIYPEIVPRLYTWGDRTSSFIGHDEKDKDDFQKIQADIAVATGKLFGKGPGNSTQRNILPNPFSDFVYAFIIEEYGLIIGGIPIILLFLILLHRGISIAINSRQKFSSNLVFGITFLFVFQAFINMLVSVGLTPVTGQPMPFVSLGGTALIICFVAYGLILSESRINNEEKEKKEMALQEAEKAEMDNLELEII